VCVCVCVCEREREGEREWVSIQICVVKYRSISRSSSSLLHSSCHTPSTIHLQHWI